MSSLHAYVKHGRLIMDEPTDLPEGTVLRLVVDDEGDDLSEKDRYALESTLTNAWNSIKEGRGIPVEELLSKLAPSK